jgi:malonyl-CoA/methylmalonyl-CoA synthetase
MRGFPREATDRCKSSHLRRRTDAAVRVRAILSEPAATPAALDPAAWVERAARDHPQRVFLRTPAGRAVSYAALLDESARLAAALLACGVGNGERVVVRTPKCTDAVLLYIACLRLGAAFVPVNPAGTVSEFEHVLRDAQPQLVVVNPDEAAALQAGIERAGVARHESLAEGAGSLHRLAAGVAPRALPDGRLTADSVAAIVYTSGTTGRPKGAMLTRANLASNAAVLARAWHFSGTDVLLHVLPLFHVHGLFVAINTVLAAGAGMLLLPKFDGASALASLPEVSVFMGVPTHYTRLLQESGLDRESTASMRLFVSGSAPLLAETHTQFERRTGHTILERYGMTETLMNTSNPYRGARLPGSVGPPLPGVGVRVSHQESGAPQPQNEIGALQVRGPNVFAGYWRDPQKTRAEFTSDGWFKTGDLGRIDAQGYVWIVGRAKDLIISGGYNVYPKEVEQELDRVAGVLESAVFGVAHPDFGEGVTAAVVLNAGAQVAEAQLLEAVRERLSAYKVPKRVLVVAELPRNAMGKVRKDALRNTYAALYGAG